jgi:flagellar biosynthesis protein FlhB
MGRQAAAVLYVVALVVVVVGVDVLFFRHQFWERLTLTSELSWCSRRSISGS